jgi:hypothetical protein
MEKGRIMQSRQLMVPVAAARTFARRDSSTGQGGRDSAKRCAIVEGLPGCDAGPAGRAAFVILEIGHALARLRGRRSGRTNGITTPDTTQAPGSEAAGSGGAATPVGPGRSPGTPSSEGMD